MYDQGPAHPYRIYMEGERSWRVDGGADCHSFAAQLHVEKFMWRGVLISPPASNISSSVLSSAHYGAAETSRQLLTLCTKVMTSSEVKLSCRQQSNRELQA